MPFPNLAHQFDVMALLTAELVVAYFLEHPPQIGLLKEAPPTSGQWTFSNVVECDFPGYQRYDLVGWTSPTLDLVYGISTADRTDWTNTGGSSETILGMIVVDSVDPTRILFGRAISAPPIGPGGIWGLQAQYANYDGYV